jgi:hypothetical protein
MVDNKTTITQEEIDQFWKEWRILMLRWNLVTLTGLLSGVVVCNFILKNYLGYKGKMATCNDTEPTFIEGDFGANWWLKENNLKPGLWSAFRWFWRNHSWNFISRFNPPWKGGAVDINEFGEEEFLVIESTVKQTKEYGRWTRANKAAGIYGVNHIAYRINGRVMCQYSKATKTYQIQKGAGGRRYRMNVKL